jgi:hypothetical protein
MGSDLADPESITTTTMSHEPKGLRRESANLTSYGVLKQALFCGFVGRRFSGEARVVRMKTGMFS